MTKKTKFSVLVIVAVFFVSGCSQTEFASHYAKKMWHADNQPVGHYKVGNPYQIKGKTYYPKEKFSHSETGIASWYGPGFHGKLTANGEVYDQYALTAAHRTLQMPSLVRVTNLENGRSIVVRVNDRGPFADNRVIDMSKRGAELLGFKNQGIARVRVDVLEEESRQIAAAARAGKDTSRIDVASLNRQTAGRYSPPRPATERRESFQPVTLQKRESAILLDDAQMIPLPESLRPEIMRQGDRVVTTQTQEFIRPEDLKIETIEMATLDDRTQPRSMTGTTAAQPKGEMDFLRDLDFMQRSSVQGHEDKGRFVPDPVVRQEPVTANALFVQAGAFGNYQNAEKLAAQLSGIGAVNISEVNVADNRFYRVRIGPMQRVEEADTALAKVISAGQKNARIIVD